MYYTIFDTCFKCVICDEIIMNGLFNGIYIYKDKDRPQFS